MRTVEARRVEVEPYGKAVLAGEQSPDPVSGPVTIIDADSGEPAVVVSKIDPTAEDRYAIRAVASSGMTLIGGRGRLSGIRYASVTFGFRPRSPLRKFYACSSCEIYRSAPAAGAALNRFAAAAADDLRAVAPGVAAAQTAAVEPIGEDWRLPGGLWTSGIVNFTARLPYHRDSNNIAGSWSSMLVMRRAVEGGQLHVPEYGLWLACDDGDLISFRGSTLWHAVTPLRPRRPDAYRITIVLYAVSGMASCLPPADEQARGRRRRTEAEERMAEQIAGRSS